MPYFALFYNVLDDFVTRRAPFRAEHLRLVGDAHDRGEIVLLAPSPNLWTLP
jgi:uncharacterized protein